MELLIEGCPDCHKTHRTDIELTDGKRRGSTEPPPEQSVQSVSHSHGCGLILALLSTAAATVLGWKGLLIGAVALGVLAGGIWLWIIVRRTLNEQFDPRTGRLSVSGLDPFERPTVNEVKQVLTLRYRCPNTGRVVEARGRLSAAGTFAVGDY